MGWLSARRDRDALAARQLDQLSEMIGALAAMRDGTTRIESHPTVYGLRALIGDTVAMLPMVAVRGAGNERLDPQPSILTRPDAAEPYRLTLEKLTNSLTRWGNAFLYVYDRDSAGFPLNVRALHPGHMTAVLDADQVRVESWLYQGRPLSARQVKHIPLMVDPGPLGTSPLVACRDAFLSLNGLWGFAAGYWVDGGTPPYALKHPKRLTAEQAYDFLAQWTEARRAHRPAVLSDGLALETYSTPSAADALLIDGLNYMDAAIARAFLVPPSMVNVVSQSSLTYATTTDETRRWLASSLYPGYLSRLEAAFSDFTPRGTKAVFDTSNLLRTDYAARVQTGSAAVAAGLITPEEWRAQEGLPPLPNPAPVSISPTVEGI